MLVEGQTEEAFVKSVLADYFASKGIFLIPKIIETKVVKGGPNHKGGIRLYGKIKRDLRNIFKDTDAGAITTMIDFYGLPPDFPSWNGSGNCYAQVTDAEKAFAEDINEQRFIPYLQLHEFEGLLFSEPELIAETMGGKLGDVQRVRDRFQTPEEINNNPQTAPSKRLEGIFGKKYNKVVFGGLIANRIGIDRLIEECPHFSEWINKISQLR